MEQPWITSRPAAEALAFAAAAEARDPLRLGAELERRFGLTAAQRAEVLTQQALRERARERWQTPVDDLLLTRDGLEQATRPVLAQWRAERLRGFGVGVIVDLGCGLGLESRAFAAAGMQVHAVEVDTHTAAMARANLEGTTAKVLVGDVTDSELLGTALDGVDAVFVDPARRDPHAPRSVDGLSGHRMSDPEQWSPPWSWVLALAKAMPRTVVKVAPGIDRAMIPEGGSAVWAAVDGDLVEASIWFPGFTEQPKRAALALTMGSATMLDSAMPKEERITSVGTHLLDVHPVVTRSGLVTTLAAHARASRIDEHIGYLTCDETPASSPFHTAYRVLDAMPFDRKHVAHALRSADCGSLTVMKRGFAADTEQLRRQWLKACTGSRAITVALTRIGDAPTAILCER